MHSSYYMLKRWLKIIRWQGRRELAALKWGREALEKAPLVLGNAMPKSGSHLIIQVLQGLVWLGPFVNPGFPPLNRSEDNRKLSDEAILANIRCLRSGDIAYGYLQARSPFLEVLAGPGSDGKAIIFVYRDPRDFIVSQVFYASEIHKGHGLHRYYTEKLNTMAERINAAIQGVQGDDDAEGDGTILLSDVRTKYERYLGWLDQANVLCLRFEDLILEREVALGRLLDYLALRGFVPRASRDEAVATLMRAIVPRKSGTFRRGKPGNWREYFTEENKALFKQVAGDLLIRLGYEKDYHW